MTLLKNIASALALGAALACAAPAQAQSMGDIEKMQAFLNIMTSYFGIVDSTYDVSSNPEKAAIMQMQKIQEVYEERGEKIRSVDALRAVLGDTDNQTIRNAAYMMMSETLKEAGRTDEALALLQQGLKENVRQVK